MLNKISAYNVLRKILKPSSTPKIPSEPEISSL